MKPLIVVTGGTKGIGLAILEQFALQGFDAITCSRNAEDLRNLKQTWQNKYPFVQLQIFQADLSKRTEIQAFTDFVLSHKRPVNVLVNNTGVFLPGQIHNEPEGVLEHIIETNLYSAYHVTRALVSGMIEHQQGYIINICSVASIMAYTHGGSYSISKFAMLGMSKSLREELKPHQIKVTSILPGATLTDSWAGVDLPSERFMAVQDVAQLLWACYQLSPSTVVEEIVMRPQLGDI
jgi:short-subunit dehydrogenase